jgi:hypothetical protein
VALPVTDLARLARELVTGTEPGSLAADHPAEGSVRFDR